MGLSSRAITRRNILLLEYRVKGYTISELAKEFNLTPQRICQILKKGKDGN